MDFREIDLSPIKFRNATNVKRTAMSMCKKWTENFASCLPCFLAYPPDTVIFFISGSALTPHFRHRKRSEIDAGDHVSQMYNQGDAQVRSARTYPVGSCSSTRFARPAQTLSEAETRPAHRTCRCRSRCPAHGVVVG
jgi:hypothetical protein